ncbi:hypothetical protein Pcinc_005878 [Petrolisthes cinctipes]|uniref:Integrase catalytic domain-containing protein n=1 Tax=Petrolisthes cinctipes TaxID=88211 RepID=A0AAE1GCG5_PETCI|nr:hypothetical protein Pcinc_005878 [Petrolisthes cinctipes]
MELLRGSGYLDNLRPGTTVLADRGFKEVEADLTAKGCHLARPASLGKDEQLSARKVVDMKIIAGLRIHVDRVNDELCKAYGIKRSVTSAYHPQTNGLAERTNRTLKTRLAKLCNTKMSDWPDYLEEVAYSMRTQKQKSTGFTPYHLMFGRQHRPIDQLQEDMDNYMYYTMMGGPIRLKSGVRPHKFDCQGKVTPHNENREKLKRKRSISKILSSVENIMEADQNPPSQPDPEEARNECEDLNDPESLTPSTKNVGIQVQIPPRIRSKAVQVVPLRADAACCTDGPEEPVERSRTENTSDHSVSSSENSDVDYDDSIDYKPSDTTSGTDDDEACLKQLTLYTTRKTILKNQMGYIGIQKQHMYIIDLLCNHISYKERGQIITGRDVVFIVLMTIRTGMANYLIANSFGVSKSCISRILTRFVPVISGCLKELICWSSSDTIRARLPHSFKAYHHKVESIIDCFEIQIEKPSSAMTQSMTWSDYKKCNSVKYLVSVTPDGLINFISNGKPGRCSDMELLRGSGYLDNLRPGTTVLADRGFKEVEADLTARGCHLARPVSVGKDEQLPAKKVVDMKIIAGLRIHVERVIRRIRVYKILDMHSCVPLSMMDILDDIVRIVCGLVNLQERICKI